MKRHQLAALVLACAACAPASADMYRWVDERGVTHYSDRRPIDSPSAETTMGRVRTVETRRVRAIEPGAPQHPPANHFATIDPQPPVAHDPCRAGGCAGASGVLYPYPVQGYVPYHRPPLAQAQLPPGAIAGTVNSPGIIPGNSASASPVIPQTFNSGPRMRPLRSPSSLEPPVHGHTQRHGRR